MKISSGSSLKGSSGIIQFRPRISSRLLASKRPSGATTSQSSFSSDISLQSSFPVCVLHILVVVSKPPVTRYLPSALNATEFTEDECPLKVLNSCPLAKSHSFAVPSELPVTRYLPSALNATEVTQSEC